MRLPGSKSISNRFLLLAALAEGETAIRDLLASDDVERMLDALKALGVDWRRGEGNDFVVCGAGGVFPAKQAELFLGNAGTAFRPLTAALALAGGHYRLSGVPRMHERPLGDVGRAETLLLSPKIYRGTHPEHAKVHVTRGKVVEAEPLGASARVLIDMDGETPGRLPIRARVLAGALRIRA